MFGWAGIKKIKIKIKKKINSYKNCISLAWSPDIWSENQFCLSLQNPLDHVSEYCKPENRPFGDLKFHGHSYIFFVDVNSSGPGTNSTANHIF